MPVMKKYRTYTTLLGFLLSLSLLQGQDESFKASAPPVVRVGEQFQYVIEGSKQGDVSLPDMEGLQMLAGPFSSYSSHSQWVNGKMTMETVVTYTFVLRASTTGNLTIAPATVKAGRKEYRTNEVAISVQDGSGQGSASGQGNGSGQAGASAGQGGPGASSGSGTGGGESVQDGGDDQVFLRVIPSKREVYVGEQFVSGLKIYTRVNTRPASGMGDIPYEGFYKKTLDPDQTATRQDIDGQQYISQVIQRHILIPQKSGEVVIEPYESEWMVQQRVQRRRSNSVFDSFFDDPFFSGVQEIPATLYTKPVTIKVNPLPEGAPAGFNGAVGDFNLMAELSVDEVEVNEALSLRVTIRGTGNLPLLGEPAVDLPPDHDIYEVNRSVNTSTAGNRISGSVVFEYPIVARHAGRYRIPPVKFSWFDPGTGEYKSAQSPEFNFLVRKGEGDEGGPTVFVPGLNQESVENLGTDIFDIERFRPRLVAVDHSLLGQKWFRLLYLLLPLITLALIVLIRIISRRNADVSLVRNRRASRAATGRLRKADRFRKKGAEEEFYEEVGKAVWGYLGDKLAIDTSRLSREEVAGELQKRGMEDEDIRSLLNLLEECEFSRFAPSASRSDPSRLYGEAVQIIKKLENRL